MNVDVKASVKADGTVTVKIDCGGQKAEVEFTDGEVSLSVPVSSGHHGAVPA